MTEISQEEHERSVHAARWPKLLDIPDVPKEGLGEMEALVEELLNAKTKDREGNDQPGDKEES